MAKMNNARRLLLGALTVITALSLVALVNSTAMAESAAAYFKGKTITWIVPYKAGGGYDTYSRLIAPFLSKYTDATVVVENKPGAGGLVGPNIMAASAPDGLTIAIVNGAGSISAQIAGEPGMRFDLTKLDWIGRVSGEPKIWTVRSSLKSIRSVKDFLNSKKTYRWGATGPGSSEYLEAKLLEAALHRKFNLITGFDGSVEIAAAMDRKEVDMFSGSVDSRLNSIKNGDERAILTIALERTNLLPKVPDVTDVKSEIPADGFMLLKAYSSVTDVARAVAAPAGVPKDRLEFLRSAFRKALQDPKLLAKTKGIHRPIEYMAAGKVLEDFTYAVDQSPKVFRTLIATSYRGNKK